MNKKEIIKFLKELQTTLIDKRDNYEYKIKHYKSIVLSENLGRPVGSDITEVAKSAEIVVNEFIMSNEYVKGQLYEIEYILEKLTE